MVGFSCILDIALVEDRQMVKDKLIDGKRLSGGLTVNLLNDKRCKW